MYRVNYGNCQVSPSFSNLKHASEHLKQCDGHAYMEGRDNGDWFPCSPENGRFLDMTNPKNKTPCPKYIQDLYGPVTIETWDEWLAFVDRAKEVLSAPSCDWNKARAFYEESGKVSLSLHRSGLHSSSSLTTKRPFPWCMVSRNLQFVSRSISLDVETSNSEFRTLAEYTED